MIFNELVNIILIFARDTVTNTTSSNHSRYLLLSVKKLSGFQVHFAACFKQFI